jgi:hypothetical protein
VLNAASDHIELSLMNMMEKVSGRSTSASTGVYFWPSAWGICLGPLHQRMIGSVPAEVGRVAVIGTPTRREPATWAVMISGFGLIAGAVRRERKISTTVRFA